MDSGDELLVRVMAEAEAAGWWQRDSTVVAAVSGGPDSMALLHMLTSMAKERPFRIVAAHVNHRFRGAESDAEAVLVADAARDWGLLFEGTVIDVPAYIEETGMNAQSAAREKRYAFLLEVAAAHGANVVLFGHHADDQAETVLMRVVRGTGLEGLSGIPYRRQEGNVELIRPLLRIPKRELLSYCERNGVPFAMDSSNFNRRYFRNAVRLDLLPHLEQYNPRLKESLLRLADTAAADDDYMETETARVFAVQAVRRGEGFKLERGRFRSLHVALQRRMIKLILKYSANPCHSLEFWQVEEILDALADDRPAVMRIDLGGARIFTREYDELYIGPPQASGSPFRHPIPQVPFSLLVPENGYRVALERLEGAVTSPPDNRWEAFFDESDLPLPLVVRCRESGDRIAPSGLNGTKKVQDMFVDAKVPRSRRDAWPLIADAKGRILWIPGLRRSRYAPVGEHTRSTIRIAVTGEFGTPDNGDRNRTMPSYRV